MHRSTVGGKVRPSKKTTAAVTPLKYHCYNHPPFEEKEYCLFSLKVNSLAFNYLLFLFKNQNEIAHA